MTRTLAYANGFFYACLIISIIFIDYYRKFLTDTYQRKLFFYVLGSSLLCITTSFANYLLTGIPGMAIYYSLYCINSLFLIGQNFAYYTLVIFIDYFIYNNATRSRVLTKIVIGFLSIYIIAVLFNLYFRFFFYISDDNIYSHGPLYYFRLGISYFPIPVVIADVIIGSKQIKIAQKYSLVFFGILTGTGAVLDIISQGGNILWICFSAALLYIYFFIVQSDSKQDALTGLENRTSFNEFIRNMMKQSVKQSYLFVIIDMDRFKEINDTFGHQEGDNALKDMAQIIRDSIRHTDFAARYGGDEFIIAAKTEKDDGRIITRIESAVKHHNEHAGRPYTLRMSYGQGYYSTHSGIDVNDFIAHVDGLMFAHKEQRKEQWRLEQTQQ